MFDYEWTITRDLVDGTKVGLVGPVDSISSSQEIVKHPDGVRFKMFDRVGIMCYEGIVIPGLWQLPTWPFDPSDDFSVPTIVATVEYNEN